MKIIIILTIVLVIFTIYFGIEENKRWNSFVTEHNCKVIGRIQGQLMTGKSTFISSPSKTGWKCDDGIEYWR